MEDQVWISHIRGITLEDDWVTVTDLMDRRHRIDPQAALELAIWIAEHHQDVAQAQAALQLERRLEEARLYNPLLGHAQPQPREHLAAPPPASPLSSKRRKRSTRKREES